jgi:hypothetical protein
MTRSSEDWVLDNIFQPFIGRDLLTTPDTILTLENNFVYYSASPSFSETLGGIRKFQQILPQ